MRSLLWLAGIPALVSWFFLSTEDASAHLIVQLPGGVACGGDDSKVTQKKGSVTDPAGDVFTFNCVNKEYFAGTIFVKATDKTTDFGRCLYDNGANILNFEVDENDNFKNIEWVNVNPPGGTIRHRNQILRALSNGPFNDPTAPTDKWLDKVNKFLNLNNIQNAADKND
jgi:hypothetical protein